MAIRVERFTRDRRADFGVLHCDANDAGWCHCVAWWTPTWDGWSERTATENASLRAELSDRGEYDGLIAYEDNEPVGWCQVGRRDRLSKLVAQFRLEPDPSVWAVTCFFVPPPWRRHGVAGALLAGAIAAAREAGASRLEGYPRSQADEPGEMWTGPAGLYARAGFAVVRDESQRAVVSLGLDGR